VIDYRMNVRVTEFGLLRQAWSMAPATSRWLGLLYPPTYTDYQDKLDQWFVYIGQTPCLMFDRHPAPVSVFLSLRLFLCFLLLPFCSGLGACGVCFFVWSFFSSCFLLLYGPGLGACGEVAHVQPRCCLSLCLFLFLLLLLCCPGLGACLPTLVPFLSLCLFLPFSLLLCCPGLGACGLADINNG
jgi:hypothetical protein